MSSDDEKAPGLVPAPSHAISRAGSNALARRGLRDLIAAEEAQRWCDLGHAYESKDDGQAALCFRRAADLGDADAEFMLAVLFQEGRGVSRNPDEAVYWFRRSADHGDVGALAILGWIYETGELVPQDYAQAAYWYLKVADLDGWENIQYRLGYMYENGLGVPQDGKQAVHWYCKAADGGDQQAKFALDKLNRSEPTGAAGFGENSRSDQILAKKRMDADNAQRQGIDRPCAGGHFQYRPELPDIDSERFTLLFDYSDDGSSYLVSYGKDLVLSGRTTNDPDDYITDSPLGQQFLEIAAKLKKRYGSRLVDLVPSERARDELTDIWGWHLKLDQGRELIRSCRSRFRGA